MSFYSDASLVLIPSGIKTSKVYSQKPTDGSGDLTFSRASIATRTNASGVIESVASNVPRLDYSGGATCPRLLLEGQRTNLALQSEAFDNAAWLKSNITVTPNVETSPDGYTNADKIVGSVPIPDLRTASTIAITSGISYTWSAYAKNAGYQYVRLTAWTSDDPVTTFDLDAISVVSETGPAHTSTITDVGNGWRRITITRTSTAAVAWLRCIPLANATGTIVQNGVDGIYLWGAQVEAGSFVSTYIPTTTAAVTRLADDCNKTGISSLIGQTEGTLFVEIPLRYLNFAAYRGLISVSDGTFNNGAFVFINNAGAISNQFSFECRASGSSVASLTASNLSTANIGSTYKIAAAYKANDFVFYINGVQIGSDTSGSIAGTLSRLDLGSIGYTGLLTVDRQTVNQALLFKTRLTNAQLASLTSL
jgi:hypothetical protein